MADKSGESTPPPAPTTSQPIYDYKPTPDESELMRLSEEWMRVALFQKDEKMLREMMSPDFTLQIWDATRAPQTLERWLDTLFNHLDQVQLEYSGLNARVFGNVGVVYSRFWWQGTLDGKPFNDGGFMVDVWTKDQGKWRVLARRSALQQQIQLLRK